MPSTRGPRKLSRTDRPFDPNAPTCNSECDGYFLVRGEIALWTAVITQALCDSQITNKRPEPMVWKREALSWLTNASPDFRAVCELALLDPKDTHRKVLNYLHNQQNPVD